MPLEIANYLSAYQRNDDVRMFVESWLNSVKQDQATIESDLQFHRWIDTNPDMAVMCVVSLAEVSGSDVDDIRLSGPLELLLAKRGNDYIDMVCELSRRVPRIAKLLTCIWGQHIPKSVMRKIELFRAG